MNIVTAWLLVAASQGPNTSPIPLATFKTEAACLASAEQLYQKAYVKKNIAYLYGICIPVEVKE